MNSLYLGIVIFIVSFFFIISEKIPSTWAALGGALSMGILGIVSEEEFYEIIGGKLEIIFLLIGLMIIVHYISETGFFVYTALTIAKFVKGDAKPILILLGLLTAVFSAFLDNVTTVLLITPISILLANQLEIDPLPFLLIEIFASNIGGSSTLIGDPPNLIIGKAGGLTFNNFINNMLPISVINLLVVSLLLLFIFRKKLKTKNSLREKVLLIDSSKSLKDRKKLIISLIVFFFVILGFILDPILNIGLSIISLTGAVLLSIVFKSSPNEILKIVEWDTLLLFLGVFVIVGGVEKVGAMEIIGNWLFSGFAHSEKATSMVILWSSAIGASLFGSLSFSMTFSHLLETIFHSSTPKIFWWALSMGACFGGNFAVLASACNIVAVNVSKKSGREISYMEYLKYGSTFTILTIIMCTLYINFRYY